MNVNGLKLRKEQALKYVHEHNNDILCLQEVHRFDSSEQHEFDKHVRGIGFFNNKVGFTGTVIIVRQNIQNLKIEHMEINNSILNEK